MNRPFDEIIHFRDDKGIFCNSKIGKITTHEKEVTCRKCRKLIDDPKRLERRRNPKVSEETKDKKNVVDQGTEKVVQVESADEEGLK